MKLRKSVVVLLALMLMVLLAACSDGAVSSSGSASGDASGNAVISGSDAISEEDMVYAQAIMNNIDAFNSRDVEVYMASMAKSADTQASREAYLALVGASDVTVSFDPEDFEVVSKSEKNVTVLAAQIMTSTDENGEVCTMRYVIEHKLVFEGENWLISSSIPMSGKDISEQSESEE